MPGGEPPPYAECVIRMGSREAAYRLLDMNRAYLTTTKLRYLFGRAAHMCGDDETAIGFLTGITEEADFERLGENAFDVYARIFAIYKEAGQTQMLRLYMDRLDDFGKRHGKRISFGGKEEPDET